MKGRKPVVSMLLVVMAMTLTMATGCGKRVGLVEEPKEEPKQEEPAAKPSEKPNPDPQPTQNPGSPTGGGGQVVQGDLLLGTPVVTGSGSALSLWMKRTVIATVDVINPTGAALSGDVTCYFGAGTEAADIQSKQVSVQPGQKQTLTFEKTGFFASAKARCEVKTNRTGVTASSYPQYY